MSIFKSNKSFSAIGVVTLVPLSFCASSAYAQAVDADRTLPPVVVTASRLEQSQTEALPHTTVITSEQIRNSQAVDVPSLLRREAGIQFTQNGGRGLLTSMFVRGSKPQQTLILVDGVPVRSQGFTGTAALEHILPDQIDHIEIVRGNVSAIYGSGAVGGVIQIFTKKGSGKPTVSVSAEAGSDKTFKLGGAASGKSGDTSYSIALTRFGTEGFSANNTTLYPNENPDKDGYRNSSLSANVSHAWAKGQDVGVRLYANEGKFKFDGGGFGTPTDQNDGQSKQHSLAIFSKNRLADNWSSTVTLSQTGTRSKNISIAPFGYDVRDNSNTTFLQWVNEVNLAPAWNLTAGIEGARQRADIFSDFGFGATQADYVRSSSSVYAGLNGKIDRHQLQFNVRHDRVGGSGAETTGFLGYGFELTPAFKLIANTSTAFSAPTLVQLYDPISGNPSLKAEKARSYELGAQYAVGSTLVRATWFNTKTRNEFVVDPNNCFNGSYPTSCPSFNLAQGSNRGLEVSAGGQVATVDVSATLTLQNPINDATGSVLLRRAKTLGSFSVSKSFGALRAGADFQYTGSRPDTDFATFPTTPKVLEAYWLANLTARYQINKSASVYGRIENLFDTEYQTTFATNQPRRGVFIGVTWQH